VVPFVARFTKEEVVPRDNEEYIVRNIFDYYGTNTKEMLKIVATNFRSVVFENIVSKNIHIKQLRKGKKSVISGMGLKPIYQTPHFTTLRLFNINCKF
jgi:F0F1-type ATP synthase delta subunit